MCCYSLTHTLNACVAQTAITGLICSGNLNMHSSFASSALAFVLRVEKSGRRASRHQRAQNNRNSKLLNSSRGSEGRRRFAAQKNNANEQRRLCVCSS